MRFDSSENRVVHLHHWNSPNAAGADLYFWNKRTLEASDFLVIFGWTLHFKATAPALTLHTLSKLPIKLWQHVYVSHARCSLIFLYTKHQFYTNFFCMEGVAVPIHNWVRKWLFTTKIRNCAPCKSCRFYSMIKYAGTKGIIQVEVDCTLFLEAANGCSKKCWNF